ncbi:MAG: ABC transporter permease [Syntrophobacteraceae bacterium]
MMGDWLAAGLHWSLVVLARATPLLFACLGGLVSECSGVINFALEGMMLAGAFGAVWAAHASGSCWWGLVGGASAGMVLGVLHAVACLGLRANQIVSSIALNLLAAGATGTLLNQVFHAYGTSPTVARLPSTGHIVGALLPDGAAQVVRVLDVLPVSALLAVGCTLGALFVFQKMALGLVVRACGEDPEGARASGIEVAKVRFGAVLCSGLLAGLGGASLSIGVLAQFVERMTQGRGYLAIAALILCRWNPKGVLLATVLLGGAEAFSEWLAVAWPSLPHQGLLAVPYGLCLLVLAVHVGKRRAPTALGRL